VQSPSLARPRKAHLQASPAPVYLGDGLAVLGFELGLLAKLDVGVNIALGCQQGLQCAAPPPARVSGRTFLLIVLSQGGFELEANLVNECFQPLLVEHFDGLTIKVMTKSIGSSSIQESRYLAVSSGS